MKEKITKNLRIKNLSLYCIHNGISYESYEKTVEGLEKKLNASMGELVGWIYEAIDHVENIADGYECTRAVLEETEGKIDAPIVISFGMEEKKLILAIASEIRDKIIKERN